MAELDNPSLMLLFAMSCLLWLLALLPPRFGKALHMVLWGAAGLGWMYLQIELGLQNEKIFFVKWLFWQLMALMIYRQTGPFSRFSRRLWTKPSTTD